MIKILAMVVGATVSVSAALPAAAGLPPKAQAAVDAYLSELKRVERSPARTSMVRLFTLSSSLAEDLLLSPVAGGLAPVEELSENEFDDLKGAVRGVVLNRDEVVFAKPDVDFLTKLAERKGTVVDRGFLSLYRKTYPESIFPAYIDQQTDFGGCTEFGTGELTQLYGAWTQFRAANPKRYAGTAKQELERIVESLTVSDCACDDAESVKKEFRLFLKRYPRSPIAAKVRARQGDVDKAGKFRFNCIAG